MDFEIQIFDKNNKVIASNIGEGMTFIEHYQSVEAINKFPEFRINLYGASVEDLFGLDEIKIKFVSNLKKYNVSACILTKEFNFSSMKAKLYGLFAPKESILKAQTQFLGNTTEEAIQSLGFEQKLHSKLNISSEFHQISETGVHALMRICDCESEIPYWTIGIQDIILSRNENVKPFIPISKVNSFIENTNLEYETIQENYDEVYFGIKVNTQYCFGNANNCNALPIGIYNYYMRKLRKPNVVINGVIEGAFPYDIGTVIKNNNPAWKNIKQFILTGLINNCSQEGFKYEVQYSCFQ